MDTMHGYLAIDRQWNKWNPLDSMDIVTIDRYSCMSSIFPNVLDFSHEVDSIDNIITIIIWSECSISDTHTRSHTTCAYHFSCICLMIRSYPSLDWMWMDSLCKARIFSVDEYVFKTCFIELHSNSYQKVNVVWKRYHQCKSVCVCMWVFVL